ncbi:MAG: hypothetical protein ACOC12_10615, partial [Bacteroidota bacterium]
MIPDKSLLKPLTFLVIALCSISCTSSKFPRPAQIDISWEVISNTYKEEPGVKARFIIRNNSEESLDGSNWEIYYNQTPRTVLHTHAQAN